MDGNLKLRFFCYKWKINLKNKIFRKKVRLKPRYQRWKRLLRILERSAVSTYFTLNPKFLSFYVLCKIWFFGSFFFNGLWKFHNYKVSFLIYNLLCTLVWVTVRKKSSFFYLTLMNHIFINFFICLWYINAHVTSIVKPQLITINF